MFSLLVPGRIGSECRRYFHRIGRAGFITIDGRVKLSLVSRAKVGDDDHALRSDNALFLRRSLRKFVPSELPEIDDALFTSLEETEKRNGKKVDNSPAGRHVRESRKVLGNSAKAKVVEKFFNKEETPVKPIVPVKLTAPVKSTALTKSRRTAKSAPPINSTVPVKSAASGTPTSSSKPTVPVKSAAFIKPTVPVKTTASVKPRAKVKTTAPIKPRTLVKTTTSVKPTAAVKTTASVKPTAPIKSAVRVKKTASVEPAVIGKSKVSSKSKASEKSVVRVKSSALVKSTASVKSTAHVKSTVPAKSKIPVRSTTPFKSKSSENVIQLSPTEPSTPPVSLQDLLTYIPPRPSAYEGEPRPDDNGNKSHSATAGEALQPVPCRLKVRGHRRRKKSLTRAGSQTSKSHRSSAAHERSCGTSSEINDRTKARASVKVKIRTKPPDFVSPAAQDKTNNVSKMLQGKKSFTYQTSKRLVKATERNEANAGKENETRTNLGTEFSSEASRLSLQNKREIGSLKDSNGSGAINEEVPSMKIDADGLIPNDEGKLPSQKLVSLKRKSSTPLKSILRSKNASKKRRETSRNVHFSESNGQSSDNEDMRVEPPVSFLRSSRNESVLLPTEDLQANEKAAKGNFAVGHEIGHALMPKAWTTHGASKSDKIEHSDFLDGVTNHGDDLDATSSFKAVSQIHDKGPEVGIAQGKVPHVEDNPSSSRSPSHQARAHLSTNEMQEQTDLLESCSSEEAEMKVNDDQRPHILAMGRDTTHALHAGFTPKKLTSRSFEHQSPNHVENVSPDRSSSEFESLTTAHEGELLDIGEPIVTNLDGDIENCEQAGKMSELSAELRNRRRVSGLTREDRTSIGFLMNHEGDKIRGIKLHPCDMANLVHGDMSSSIEEAVSTREAHAEDISSSPRAWDEDMHIEQDRNSILKDADAQVESEYSVMQTRVEQTRLLLRLFVDVVEPVGERLGHKRQRLKLLESFDETESWLRFTEGSAATKKPLKVPDLLGTAKIGATLDNPNVRKLSKVHVGGLARYWGVLPDMYMSRLKEMEVKQQVEVDIKRRVDACF